MNICVRRGPFAPRSGLDDARGLQIAEGGTHRWPVYFRCAGDIRQWMDEPDPEPQAVLPHDRCVLIVEDNYFIARDLTAGFAKAGLKIIGPVGSLSKALAAVQREQINGAVLDINLDGEKVYEVADALIERRIPVVFVTGYDRSSIPSRYDDIPLCLKPIDSQSVVAALRRAGTF